MKIDSDILNGKRWRCDCSDALTFLRGLPDGTARTCVTSPPYFGLRDYGVDGQIGLEPTPTEFVSKLVDVFREVRRVLTKDGTCFVNIGDSYFGGGRGGNPENSHHKKQRTNVGSLTVSGVRHGARLNGNSCREPQDCQGAGSFCSDLCGECAAALSIRSSGICQRSPVSSSRRGKKDRGKLHQDSSEAAAAYAPLSALESTTSVSSLQQQENCSHCSNCGVCLRVLNSSSRDGLLCDRRALCKIGTEPNESACRNHGMDALGLAYPYSTTTALKSKDLIGIPWRLAFAMQADGWYLRQDIIWHKPNPMPESVRDRCTKAHEYIFLLSKSDRYFFDSDAMKEQATSNSSGAAASFKRSGSKREQTIPGQGYGTHRPEREEVAYNETRNKRSVWTVCPASYKGAHFATFPAELITPCILAGSAVDDIVLEPFSGSGTTLATAVSLGRRALACELNPNYMKLIRNRMSTVTPPIPGMYHKE